MIMRVMPDDSPKRLAIRAAIELRLNNEVVEARVKYDQAKLEFEATAAQARSLGLDTADGAHAIRVAARHERSATEAYCEAIARYCEFILRGTLPEA